MKKLIALLLTIMIMMSLSVFAEAEPRQIILLTEYRQMGWGERYALGVVDDEGGLWSYACSSWTDLPFEMTELILWAENNNEFEYLGTLSSSQLREVKSLVITVRHGEGKPAQAACDAGTQSSYACRRDKDGKIETVLLGMSGDDMYENTDPSAQTLYRILRQCFAAVTAYDGEQGMSPKGFKAVSLEEFCGYDGLDLTALTLTAYRHDCEEGNIPTEPVLTGGDIASMIVTGKKNSLSVTGNTTVYAFTDDDGDTVAAFEFYGDLLVMNDGMYTVSNLNK